ncbi:hypothetical protein G7Y41_09170 [Schaalia sp. ZJ405]|uniref:hypothetical protein n=1 Tax=Schaalia sp. ZJ405 TaxID=2709403 RepID=UPI0013EADC52|nr:hypothetical protein [Schaalia sp. ZJ405]QPK81189.1 hypothetical protein G7Y41_09170 [Schaalia sp. ZJ405]
MTNFLLGLAVALLGAVLLASGSEMQSRAVYVARGRWTVFLRNPRWILGMLLLGTAICTNFIALALAPISAIQSMSIVALAASAVFGAAVGRIRLTRAIIAAVIASMIGILGFISVIATHQGAQGHANYDGQLPRALAIQAGIAAIGAVVTLVGRTRTDRPSRLFGLIVGAAEFGSITAVFKVLVRLVVRDGFSDVFTRTLALLAIGSIAIGGVIAIAQLQLAHKALPAPTVVAGLTITDTITAAIIGTLVLKESALTTGSATVLIICGTIAIGGVIGMRNLKRTSDLGETLNPEPPHLPAVKEASDDAHRILQ